MEFLLGFSKTKKQMQKKQQKMNEKQNAGGWRGERPKDKLHVLNFPRVDFSKLRMLTDVFVCLFCLGLFLVWRSQMNNLQSSDRSVVVESGYSGYSVL